MNLSVGIVGLPNVGKSTLFNALLKKQSSFAKASAGQAGFDEAKVGNYAFTTIEPNVGVVAVPDSRLKQLARIAALELAGHVILGTQSAAWSTPESDSGQVLRPRAADRGARMTGLKLPPIKPATVEFVDIAGLVKGASEGAGLGNKFLSHIREVEVICHVVRAFADENVIKEGSVDPKSDYETISTELILADLATVQKTQSQLKRFQNPADKTAIEKLFKALDSGIPARDVQLSEEEQAFAKPLFLLSAKPEIIVLNVSEEEYSPEKIEKVIEQYKKLLFPVTASEARQSQDSGQARMTAGIASSQASRNDNNVVVISAQIESDLAALSDEEQKEYLAGLGLQQSGLERLIKKAYETLGLISFLTAGEKEVRAWTIQKGLKAPEAAGAIHTDFTKKFIKAEVVSFEDFVSSHGWKGSREKGKARLEGRDYIIHNGDVVEFKIGA